MVKNKTLGKYYNNSDYASLLKRILVICIDLPVLALFAYLVAKLWPYFAEPLDLDLVAELGWQSAAILTPEYFWVNIAFAYLYLAVFKRSFIRTVGYHLFKLKIVDLQGNQPSLFKMSFRFLLLVIGPFHLLIDLFWLGGDESKQTLRDKLVGTCVVKENAQPIGEGNIEFSRYYLMGLSLLFQEVNRNNIVMDKSNLTSQ